MMPDKRPNDTAIRNLYGPSAAKRLFKHQEEAYKDARRIDADSEEEASQRRPADPQERYTTTR